jgi:hypothetical protein
LDHREEPGFTRRGWLCAGPAIFLVFSEGAPFGVREAQSRFRIGNDLGRAKRRQAAALQDEIRPWKNNIDADGFVVQSPPMQTDWAEENLQVIRTLMERSAVYRRALAPVMSLVGATGIAAGVLGAALDFKASRPFVVYWVAVALVCLAESFLLIRRQAIKALEPFWSPPTRRVAQAVRPAFFVGLMMAIGAYVLDNNQMIEPLILLLVPIWMVLYGLAMHAAGFFMPRGVRIFGWGYILAGLGGIGYWFYRVFFFEPDFAPFNSNIAMSVFFGGGHAAYGLYLYFTEKRRNVA